MGNVIVVFAFIAYIYWAQTSSLKQEIIKLQEKPDSEKDIKYKEYLINRYFSAALLCCIAAIVGSFIGVAGFGSAIAGTYPCAILGYLVGWLMASKDVEPY
ncbi:hypothetical protein [Endozoicomonas sp. ISHI1]|uniref:hypothetical protein n=1 Tax=Endozoicomonas sp. ISHI1 TaxID=2825882 RepID=UPI0021480C3E|nr:hypothetical protein [Endozoicomonas sp. ISHI1]